MSFFNPDILVEYLHSLAYQPNLLYLAVVCFMTASSFGLPIPEEVVLITCGLIAYMGTHPEVYPDPGDGSVAVNVYILATVCFLSVLFSDLIIYFIGRFFGDKLVKSQFFKKRIGEERFSKINSWFHRYSSWACGIFRFTPGIRFPGHMTCGIMRIPLWKFIAIDGTAALISVPTQVLLVAYNGEIILSKIKEFKLIFLSVILVTIIIYVLVNNRKKLKHS